MAKKKFKIAVMGASGRMGQELIKGVIKNNLVLVGATERPGHKWIGRDIGTCLGLAESGVSVVDNALELFAKADAVLDFTTPKASVFHAELAAQSKCVLVIGTTGFSAADLKKITAAARHARIIRAGNMSLGMTLLTELAGVAGILLKNDFDINIIESHHRNKVDAPSGTALMLATSVTGKKRGLTFEAISKRSNAGITGPRKKGTIGFNSIRAGDIVGEHDIVFAGKGERLILSHVATDRAIFVNGALHAAAWGLNQSVGEYDMRDVIGLKREEYEKPS